MTKIKSPIEGYNGSSTFGSTTLVFTDGEADAKDIPDGVLAYLREKGFGVDGKTVDQPDAPAVVDSRDIVEEQVGTKARDAAVDPKPEDFLPPVNAGKADPHGPKVVAPQIHAAKEQPVRPGDVADDNAVQEKAESEHAAENLVAEPAVKPKTTRARKSTEPVGGLSE